MEPGGSAIEYQEPVLQVQYDNAGSYETYAATNVNTNGMATTNLGIQSGSSSTIDIAAN